LERIKQTLLWKAEARAEGSGSASDLAKENAAEGERAKKSSVKKEVSWWGGYKDLKIPASSNHEPPSRGRQNFPTEPRGRRLFKGWKGEACSKKEARTAEQARRRKENRGGERKVALRWE